MSLIPQYDGCNDESLNKQSSLYPTLLYTNARSIMPKMECICSTIEQERVDISFVSEMWLQSTNPLHIRELERRLNLDGLEFYSNSHVSQRGGGVGIIVNTSRGFSGTRLQVNSRVGKNS